MGCDSEAWEVISTPKQYRFGQFLSIHAYLTTIVESFVINTTNG